MPLDHLAAPVPASLLRSVLAEGTNIAVWRRPLPDGLAPCLAPLMAHGPFVASAEAAPAAALAALAARLPAPLLAALHADILALAAGFTVLTGDEVLRIRLEALRGRGCHRWHADAVGLRLLCTYRGPGTEWLDLAGGAAKARRLEPSSIVPQRLGAGDVAVLKGERWPGNAGNGCIHRSPPNGEDAPLRLVLCLDEAGRIPLE